MDVECFFIRQLGKIVAKKVCLDEILDIGKKFHRAVRDQRDYLFGLLVRCLIIYKIVVVELSTLHDGRPMKVIRIGIVKIKVFV